MRENELLRERLTQR